MRTGDDRSVTVRFRHDQARMVAGLIVTVSVFTLVAVWPWSALLLVPPAVWTGWLWRAGTDADQTGVRVRALLGQRRIRWADIDSLSVDDRGRVSAVLTSGNQVRLTAVAAGDLPRLTATAPST